MNSQIRGLTTHRMEILISNRFTMAIAHYIAIQLELDAFSIMKHFVSLGVRTLRGYRRDLDKGTFND